MALTRIANIASTIPDDSIANVKMANIVQSKNIIINGDMQVSQRSTSTASVTTVGYYTVDRMQWIADYGTVTLSQDTDVPSGYGFANSFKADVTTAGTVVSAGYVLLRQKIEGQNLQYLKKGTSSAQSLTLSFWIKSTKTGTYIAELYDNDNTRQISKSYTVSASNTWEKKTITFAGDTTGAFGNDNAASLFVNLYLSAGSDYTSGTLNTSWAASTNANRVVGQVDAQDNTSNNIYFTGIQLEAGDTASEFEFLPYDLNLQRCQRYCLVLGDAPGGATYDYADNGVIGHYYNTTDFYPNWFYPVPMRGTPGVSFSTTGSGLGDVSSQNTAKTGTSAGTNATSSTNINFRISTATATQGSGGAFNFAASNYVILSAEL
tara:strand:- start:180 stop:1310 length:1131 start_codon:yes stop_codon:yes gene_type:complete